MDWEPQTQQKFEQMMQKVPVFLRTIAQEKISARAKKMVELDGRNLVLEKDMVDAFFAETPFGFHGPMKCDMQELGINYVQYGYTH